MTGLRRSELRAALVLLLLMSPAVPPLVLCVGAGHSAIEVLGAECCAPVPAEPDRLGRSCAPDCTDILVGSVLATRAADDGVTLTTVHHAARGIASPLGPASFPSSALLIHRRNVREEASPPAPHLQSIVLRC